jgi:hypothetical protein
MPVEHLVLAQLDAPAQLDATCGTTDAAQSVLALAPTIRHYVPRSSL